MTQRKEPNPQVYICPVLGRGADEQCFQLHSGCIKGSSSHHSEQCQRLLVSAGQQLYVSKDYHDTDPVQVSVIHAVLSA
jgi:hypothetical protein